MQIRLIAKQSQKDYLLVPYYFAAPAFKSVVSADGTPALKSEPRQGLDVKALLDTKAIQVNVDSRRPNTYKHFSNDIGTWSITNHHVAFVPIELTPMMPSGNKYSRCLITIQAQQKPLFYVLKV